jgi:hypothetical protein
VPNSPSIWCARAIRAQSFRPIDAPGTERARLCCKSVSASPHSSLSTAFDPRLKGTNGSSGRSLSSSRRSAYRARASRPEGTGQYSRCARP